MQKRIFDIHDALHNYTLIPPFAFFNWRLDDVETSKLTDPPLATKNTICIIMTDPRVQSYSTWPKWIIMYYFNIKSECYAKRDYQKC